MDYYQKLFYYQKAGVRESWIVDSEKNQVLVYRFERDLLDCYTCKDTIPAGIYEDLEIDLSEIRIG